MKPQETVASRRPGVGDEARYEHVALARIVDALTVEFAGRVDGQRVATAVADARARFRDAPLREYIPVMVERRARAELTAISHGSHSRSVSR